MRCNRVLVFTFVMGLLSGLNSSHAVTIVSDIDDTLKVMNVNNPASLAAHALTRIAFTGMPETYQALSDADPENRKFFYLSARPDLFQNSTEIFLSSKEFPEGVIILKDKSDPKNALEYKKAKLRSLLSSFFNKIKTPLILIGDDTQYDPEAYEAVRNEFPEQIKGIYIRQILNRSLPIGVSSFVTAYDLAVSLKKVGVLPPEGLEKVARAIFQETRAERIIPKFQFCPRNYEAEDQLLAKKIREICSRRLKFNP